MGGCVWKHLWETASRTIFSFNSSCIFITLLCCNFLYMTASAFGSLLDFFFFFFFELQILFWKNRTFVLFLRISQTWASSAFPRKFRGLYVGIFKIRFFACYMSHTCMFLSPVLALQMFPRFLLSYILMSDQQYFATNIQSSTISYSSIPRHLSTGILEKSCRNFRKNASISATKK